MAFLADGGGQSYTAHRDMRHGIVVSFCPFLIRKDFTVFLPSVQNLTRRIG